MEKLNALSRGQQIILVAGVLLLIDTFLDWQHVSVNINGVTVGGGGQSAWHGFWGFFMGLMLIVLLAWTAARAFNVALPEQVPDGLVTLALGVLIPVFALIKAISDSYVHWPAWVGVILGAVIAYGAWQVFAASGEKLPSMPARDTPTA
jgi:cellobiose-specific phosphotransferase system component IIC